MMNKVFRDLVLISLVVFVSNTYAQNETDVVRYLDTSPSGTARVSSMAGSFGALGGDLSVALINPAGIGVYRKGEIGITPGFTINNTKSSAFNSEETSQKSKFIFSNIAYVTSNSSEDNKSMYINFSIGYSKVADFNRNSELSYINGSSSMLTAFSNRAYGIFVQDLESELPYSSYLAYETYLIDDQLDTPTVYTTQPLYEDSFIGVGQANNVEEKGAMGEVFLNLAASISEKLYIGTTMGLVRGNYEMNSNFTETTLDDSLLLDSYTFNYLQATQINGLNIKLGLIYKPEQWLRLAIAYHIPYKLSINDEFSTSIRSQFKDGDFFSVDSRQGYAEYQLRNPGKLIMSAALIGGSRGLINMDFEWVNYKGARFSSGELDYSPENEQISENLRNAITMRIGGEIWKGRYNFRAGYALRQNPYSYVRGSEKNSYNTISGGVGMVTDNSFYINLSVSYQEDAQSYYPYSNDIAPLITDKYQSYEVLFSLGTRF